MLYEIFFEEVPQTEFFTDEEFHSETIIVEGLDYLYRKSHVVLPALLERWTQERAHQISVTLHFVPVKVTVSRYFPARVGMDRETFTVCVRSVLKEWEYQAVRKVGSY